MSTARLKVGFAGPLVSVQDAGRFGQMRFGVPASGPMDRVACRAAFAALGRPVGACIEVSLGGLVLEREESDEFDQLTATATLGVQRRLSRKWVAGVGGLLDRHPVDVLMVQGDTTTCFAAGIRNLWPFR